MASQGGTAAAWNATLAFTVMLALHHCEPPGLVAVLSHIRYGITAEMHYLNSLFGLAGCWKEWSSTAPDIVCYPG